MDDTVLSNVESDFSKICHVFAKTDEAKFPTQERPTVIKYTKLPEYDVMPAKFQQNNSGPRIRRFTELSKEVEETSRSLQSNFCISSLIQPNSSKRKVVTIEEDKETPLSNTGNNTRKSRKGSFKSQPAQKPKVEKQSNTHTPKSSKSFNTTAKEPTVDPNTEATKKEMKKSHSADKNKNARNSKDRAVPRAKRNGGYNYRQGKKKSTLDDKLFSPPSPFLMKSKTIKPEDITSHYNLDTLLGTCHTIHVPLEHSCGYLPPTRITEIDMNDYLRDDINTRYDQATYTSVPKKDKNYGTKPDTKSTVTETINNIFNESSQQRKQRNMKSQTCTGGEPYYESLYIPNLTLKKDKRVIELSDDQTIDIFNDPNVTSKKDTKIVELSDEKMISILSDTTPSLKIPSFKITKQKDNIDDEKEDVYENESSYIIRQATVTYTTKQKINFQVVGSKDIVKPKSDSTYPLNVMSILKTEMTQQKVDSSETISNIPKQLYTQAIHDLESSINYAFNFHGNKLMTPSDVIDIVTDNVGKFNSSFISEQFQKELDFISSFVESLHYLENCSQSRTSLPLQIEKTYEDLVQEEEFKHGYNAMFAEGGVYNIVEQTSASKNLCLLNMLIRDEQRRANNLLFVLKMREDALKDFTKSQIIWLENKKKLDNTDASTLKKKQRGALLKLHHECGEMEKMRKALVSLSEKRKTALLNTKRNIELKLSGKEDVDQPAAHSKKKIKKSSESVVLPVKCYELTSTCSNNSDSQVYVDSLKLENNNDDGYIAGSAEKSVQTGDSILGPLLIDRGTNTMGESFVVVDGGYLNILFHNLALPKIFCEGKQYEMNEEALKNILTSSNLLKENASEDKFIERLVEQVRNGDGESTPSTARSLVEELDQFYRDMDYKQETSADINQSSADTESDSVPVVNEDLTTDLGMYNNPNFQEVDKMENNSLTSYSDYVSNLGNSMQRINIEECSCSSHDQVTSEAIASSVSGIQLSAIDSPMLYELSSMPAMGIWQPMTPEDVADVSTEEASYADMEPPQPSTSMTTQTTRAVSEAEELRRQQLAIEQEIKALEQQQLLVVREIPDKPPPPYMPPVDPRAMRRFLPDDTLEAKVQEHLQETNVDLHIDSDDSYEDYIKDFCMESVERQRCTQSDKPWDASNLLTKAADASVESIQKRTTSELREVLTGVTPGCVPGLSGNRRSDHIDDILFSEWRRCEPEWTSLHVDEVAVKNQLFDSIFQKILSETIDEYKVKVVNPPDKTDKPDESDEEE